MNNKNEDIDVIGSDGENSENSQNDGPSHPKKSHTSFTIKKKTPEGFQLLQNIQNVMLEKVCELFNEIDLLQDEEK